MSYLYYEIVEEKSAELALKNLLELNQKIEKNFLSKFTSIFSLQQFSVQDFLRWSQVLISNLTVFQEYERAVIFRLGRVKRGGAVGPGLFFIVPCMDQFNVVDLRTVSFDVPPQVCQLTQFLSVSFL